MKCFYHSADLDGHCSGAIIKKKFPECEMIGINYGDEFPWDSIEKDEQVFMVDFSLQPWGEMQRLRDMCQLIWIDHHVSAITEWEQDDPWACTCRLDVSKAGCELVWEYCYPDVDMPESVRLLGRYDIWDHAYSENVMPFQWGMRLYDTLPINAIWDMVIFNRDDLVLYDMRRIIGQGLLILKFRDQENKKYIEYCSFDAVFEGLRAVVVNKGMTNSQLFDSVWDPDKYDVMITFVWRNGSWTVSLYSDKADVDVSVLAKARGGGGHKGAAGYQTTEFPIVKIHRLMDTSEQ